MAARELGRLHSVAAMLTGKCSLKCDGCVFSGRLERSDLSEQAVRNLVEGIGEKDTVILTGGEPTLHPRFFDIVSMIAKKRPLLIRVVTNAVSFTRTPQSAEKFASSFKQAVGSANAELVMSVDPQHEKSLGVGERGLQRQSLMAWRFREACRKIGVNHVYCVHGTPGEKTAAKTLIEQASGRYGLPLKPESNYLGILNGGRWVGKGELSVYSAAPVVFVDYLGNVHRSESDFVQGSRPKGDLKLEPLSRVRDRL